MEAFADCGIRNLIVLSRSKNLRFKAGAFKNNHLTKLDFPSNVDYIFENGEGLSSHTWGIPDVSSPTYLTPVFSGNDFVTFLSLNQIGTQSQSSILETHGETTAVQSTMKTGVENCRKSFTNLVAKACQ